MTHANRNRTLVALALGALLTAPAAFADSPLTQAQLDDERRNLHADGSLPFIHAPVLYGTGRDGTVVWTDERIDEFDNLHADGSFPFIHSPDAFSSGASDAETVWTEETLAEFRNLRSDGSLL